MDTNTIAFASSSLLQTSYTPVKRRESTINTRQFHAEPEKEWTTARCNRLLRALTSRVTLLKKELFRCSQSLEVTTLNDPSGKSQSKSSDTDWIQSKKRVRKTYSIRGGKSGHGMKSTNRRTMKPGEVIIPTPILARVRYERASESLETIPYPSSQDVVDEATSKRPNKRKASGREGDFQLTKSLRTIRQEISAPRYTNYEGIYNGLESLLRATEQEQPETKRKGARSLASMALRAMPRYVKQQEDLLEAHMKETGSRSAIQNRDIATEIYDELQDFGTSGNGWPQLRIVVRAHGIQVLIDGISSGLFDLDFCGALVTLCAHLSSIDEAQLLLSAILSSTTFPKARTIYDPCSRPISMLCKFTHHFGLKSYCYRQLTSLVSSNLLPVEWLATREFGSIWAEAIQTSLHDPEARDALKFLEIALSALFHVRQATSNDRILSTGMAEAIGNTSSSLLTTLLSIIILSKDTTMPDIETSTRSQCFRTLLENCIFACHGQDSFSARVSVLPLLVNLVLEADTSDPSTLDSCTHNALATSLDENYHNVESAVGHEAAMFIYQVAHCCGRGASTSGFDYLKRLHTILECLLVGKPNTKSLMALIVDSGFAFARKVPDRKHLDYAAALDSKYHSRNIKLNNGHYNTSVNDQSDENSGFRWEEGIGEWVTATPAAQNAKRKHAVAKPSSNNDQCDTPYRPPRQLRRSHLELQATTTRTFPTTNMLDEDVVEAEDDVEMSSSPQCSFYKSVTRASSISSQSRGDDSSMSDSADELVGTSLESADTSVIDEMDELDETEDEFELSFIGESITSNSPSALKSTLLPSRRASIYRAPRLKRKAIHSLDDWEVSDESFSSTTSSQASNDSTEFSGPRRGLIDRAPRLGRKALRTCEAFKLFDDESDDELSFLSVSSQSDQALKDVTRSSVTNTRRSRQAKPASTHSRSQREGKQIAAALSDSEDELCI